MSKALAVLEKRHLLEKTGKGFDDDDMDWDLVNQAYVLMGKYRESFALCNNKSVDRYDEGIIKGLTIPYMIYLLGMRYGGGKADSLKDIKFGWRASFELPWSTNDKNDIMYSFIDIAEKNEGLKNDIEKAVADGKVMEIIADLGFMNRQLKRPVKQVLNELKEDDDYMFVSEEDVYSLNGWVLELYREMDYEDEYYFDDEYEDGYGGMEEWEAEGEFFDRKDWKGLLEYRRQKAEKYPDDPDCQWGLGEAYVLNEEYEKAISLLSNLHKDYPDDTNIQHSLLDALFATGKDETVVKWVDDPNILRLDQGTLDYCYNFMKKKRKPRTVYELHLEFYNEGYPAFNDNQLMAFLHSDNRFLLTGSSTESHNCFVSVNKKGKG